MKAYNEPMTAAEREQYEADNLKRLLAKIAVVYKCKVNMFGFVKVTEEPQCKYKGMDVQPFSINQDGKRIGLYRLFLPTYKDAKNKAIMPRINPNHIENYLPTKKTA